MNDKVYEPEVIDTVSFPDSAEQTSIASSDGSSKTVLTPNTNVDQTFPLKEIARELISESLNSHTKRILGAFTFGQVGALEIGVYEFGVSGDIRITPNGITARDINGDTTFFIDGTTGDATFKGTIMAGAIISADISADNIVGGTLKLGGNNNVNGIANIYSGAGNLSAEFNKDALEFYGTDLAGISFYDAPAKNTFFGAFGYTVAGNLVMTTGATGNKSIMIHADGTDGQLHLYTNGSNAQLTVSTALSDIVIDAHNDLWLTTTNGDIYIGNDFNLNGHRVLGGDYVNINSRSSNPSVNNSFFVKNNKPWFIDSGGNAKELNSGTF